MNQEQPVGSMKSSFVFIGRILLVVGLLGVALYLVPFMAASSKRAAGKKTMEYSAEEKVKMETIMSITNRRIIMLSSGYAPKNPANIAGSQEKAKLEEEYRLQRVKYNSLSRAEYIAEQMFDKSQKIIESKGIYAGLSVALLITGAVLLIYSKMVDI